MTAKLWCIELCAIFFWTNLYYLSVFRVIDIHISEDISNHTSLMFLPHPNDVVVSHYLANLKVVFCENANTVSIAIYLKQCILCFTR